MPNWASGQVRIIGEKKNVRKSLHRFLSSIENLQYRMSNVKYFARSFIDSSYKDIFENFEIDTNQSKESDIMNYVIYVSFAWSAYGCLVEGYPQKYQDICIDLETACKLDDVEMEIYTEEEGIGFEEHIICNRYGEIIKNECIDMLRYECVSCGNTQLFPRQESEYCCMDCGKEGIANWHLKLD